MRGARQSPWPTQSGAPDGPVSVFGRYAVYGAIASGGMATVHVGRIFGEAGFTRTVAIKRMHPHLAGQPEFVAMFVDEARLAARIRHPNVVPTLDVAAHEGELFLVMEYVDGVPLSALHKAARESGVLAPPDVAASIMVGLLRGLDAAHEARGDDGLPLGIVHRDVSPQNVLVGTDGVARVLDFGVAKALSQVHITQNSQLKGKLAYMAPEQVRGEGFDRRADVFGAAVVFWETLCGTKLFRAANEAAVVQAVQYQPIARPSEANPAIPPALDAVIMHGLDRDPERRFATAGEMADAIEHAIPLASARVVGEWVRSLGGVGIRTRAQLVADAESRSNVGSRPAGEHITHSQVQKRAPVVEAPPVVEETKWRYIAVACMALGGAIALGFAGYILHARSKQATVAPVDEAEAKKPAASAVAASSAPVAASSAAISPTASAAPTAAASADIELPDTPSDSRGFAAAAPKAGGPIPTSRGGGTVAPKPSATGGGGDDLYSRH